MTAIRRGALKGVLVGFLVGLVFPVLAWIVAGGGSAVVIRQDQPVTWLVDAVPFCLAVIGGFLGAGYARFVQLQTDTASIAERIVDEWTEEIHNSNVEIARSADSQARFFAALSHDMRTPLSAIIGFSSLVEGSRDLGSALGEDAVRGRNGDAETHLDRVGATTVEPGAGRATERLGEGFVPREATAPIRGAAYAVRAPRPAPAVCERRPSVGGAAGRLSAGPR